jgi:O-methyltransferase domain
MTEEKQSVSYRSATIDMFSASNSRHRTWFSLKHAPLDSDIWTNPETTSIFTIENASPIKVFDMPPGEDMWSYIDKTTPYKMQEFARAMTALGTLGIAGLLADFPWHGFPKDTKIVDVGGGHGGMLLPLLRTFPHLRGVLQDLESTVARAEENFKDNYPEAIEQGRVEFQSANFFDSQPRKGYEYVYMLRWVVHDWPDERALQILKNQSSVMSKNSTLLIVEPILQPATLSMSDGSDGTTPPYP